MSGVDDWISDIQISDDSQFLAFMVGTTTDPLDETKFVGKELYWTPIIGGGATSVAIANTEITSYQFIGDTLIFTGDLDTPGKIELYHFIWFAGNHDSDRDVDGADFLTWQRGDSPNPLSASNLADWRELWELSQSDDRASTAVPGADDRTHAVVRDDGSIDSRTQSSTP